VQQIMRYTKGRIRREDVPSLTAVEEKRTSSLFDTLRKTLEAGDYARHDESVDRLLDAGHTATDIASALLSLLTGDKPAGEQIPEDMPKRPRSEYPAYVSRTSGAAPRETTREPRAEATAAGAKTAESKRPAREGTRTKSAAANFDWSQELTERPRAKRRESASEYERPERPDYESERPRSRTRERSDRAGRDEPVERTSHEEGMVRIAFNQGREHGIAPGDVVGVIAGAAKVPRECIGAIKLLPRETLVDVNEDVAELILKKLAGIRFKGKKLLVLPATKVGKK
jgi:ATP-dependent RNA helicase DeaD